RNAILVGELFGWNRGYSFARSDIHHSYLLFGFRILGPQFFQDTGEKMQFFNRLLEYREVSSVAGKGAHGWERRIHLDGGPRCSRKQVNYFIFMFRILVFTEGRISANEQPRIIRKKKPCVIESLPKIRFSLPADTLAVQKHERTKITQ